jgi:(E)-4-hydroxy-3-methylbut-2-enyl-diphosphate synthase
MVEKMFQQRLSRKIYLGKVAIGGDAPVSIQSMTNTHALDVDGTIKQIERLTKAGCEIIRVAVDDYQTAKNLREICQASTIPVIADIQFDAHSAILAIENGAAGVRINPGLFHDNDALTALAKTAIDHNTVIRVGANGGSIGTAEIKERISKGATHDDAIAYALFEATLAQCQKLESLGVYNIKAAVKSSSIAITLKANYLLAQNSDYPLHLGITEAGTPNCGIVKSSCGIGAMLLSGIGNTIRVSLTADPEEEVLCAKRILESCGLRLAKPEIISCPTCGRTEIDLVNLVDQVEKIIAKVKSNDKELNIQKIAVMGCPVNGPGEAKDADIGLAGTRSGKVVLFKSGNVIGAYNIDEGLKLLENELNKSII